MLPDSTTSLEQTSLLEKDLHTLYEDIRRAHSLGIAWDEDHYGFNMQTFYKWRLDILELKQKLHLKDKQKEKTA